jgi:alginate O-acetyltransferase complex protein AlgI
MSFVQAEFLALLLAVFAAYWAVRTQWQQNLVLVLASLVFYGWVSPWWVAVLLVSVTVDFVTGQLMVRARPYRALWLGISLSANLSLLLYFKYMGFFVDNLVAALTALEVPTHLSTLQILLPAGISFYTFQTMSYTIDIYRGALRPRTNYLDYLTFVSFFPQLVAGPIERAGSLLVQLEARRRFSHVDLREGLGLALYGAFKKLVIADTLAPFVDKVFVHTDPAGPLLWAATTAFMVQIYADFSGYTDIARGVARMLGIHLVKNFDEPWRATTTPEFWARWHISLSTWIRDYVLTPLLGQADQITPLRYAGAVTVTMVLMGAWHGAGWNFIAFGLYQAVCILGYTWLVRNLPDWMRTIRHGRVLAAILHILVVGEIGALMFREPSLARFWQHLSKSPFHGTEDEWRAAVVILTLAGLFSLTGVAEHLVRHRLLPAVRGSVWMLPVHTTGWSVMAAMIVLFYRSSSYDFIYFRF